MMKLADDRKVREFMNVKSAGLCYTYSTGVDLPSRRGCARGWMRTGCGKGDFARAAEIKLGEPPKAEFVSRRIRMFDKAVRGSTPCFSGCRLDRVSGEWLTRLPMTCLQEETGRLHRAYHHRLRVPPAGAQTQPRSRRHRRPHRRRPAGDRAQTESLNGLLEGGVCIDTGVEDGRAR